MVHLETDRASAQCHLGKIQTMCGANAFRIPHPRRACRECDAEASRMRLPRVLRPIVPFFLLRRQVVAEVDRRRPLLDKLPVLQRYQ